MMRRYVCARDACATASSAASSTTIAIALDSIRRIGAGVRACGARMRRHRARCVVVS